jgi:hypothetical protein
MAYMEQEQIEVKTFIPSDVKKIAMKIRQTWTKLTDNEIEHYLEGKRDQLLLVLQHKYSFSEEQAETTLSSIERLA